MKNVFQWKDLFDFSNFPKGSKIFDETNKKVIGKIFIWWSYCKVLSTKLFLPVVL